MQISPETKAAILIAIVASVIFGVSLAVWQFMPREWKPVAYLFGFSLGIAALFLERYFKISEALVRSGKAGRPRQTARSQLRSRAESGSQRALRFVRSIKDWLGLGQPWSYDFCQQVESAIAHNIQYHVQCKKALCGGRFKRALWAHPPKEGDGYYLYKVPIPKNVQRAKLSFSVGIRDEADMKPPNNIVQFKIYVDDRLEFDEPFRGFYWCPCLVYVDVPPGDECEVKFVTNAMGEDRGNWAVWGQPVLEAVK